MASSPPSSLKRLQIEPTNRCNFRCVFCRRTHWHRKIGDMSLAQFETLLGKLPPAGHVHLQGQGEPLLNDDFPEMVRTAKAKGLTVGTSTNASLLTAGLAKRLLDAGIDRINLSLDTAEPILFSQSRPGMPLEMILENISRLVQIKMAGGYKVALAAGVVARQSTISGLPGVIAAASDIGLDEVYVQNLNNDFLPELLQEAETCPGEKDSWFAGVLAAARETAAARGVKLLLPDFDPQPGYRCRWPFDGCNITWDGYVAPCCLQPDPDVLSFGNIFETDFAKIWGSGAYRKFRDSARNGSADICQACPDLKGQMWHPQAAPL